MFIRSIFNAATELARDMRFAVRSLLRAKGLATTVVITLGLGIGANAAIFSIVRGVLLRPLVNRDEDRLIYIRQTAPGIGIENYTFSMPEIGDFKQRVTTIGAFGDFSTVDLAMIAYGGEPRMVKAGVVNGSFFEVMGLRPALGRLLTPQDDGPKAAGVAVLTYRFWTTAFNSDPTVVGKKIRLGVVPGVRPAFAVVARVRRSRPDQRHRANHPRHEPPPADICDDADRVFVRAARWRGNAARHARDAADGTHRLRHATGARARNPDAGAGTRKGHKGRARIL
jgi:hypothetical protein